MNERLYRSRSDRVVAGVAGGLAEIWNLDPSIVRVVWAVLVPLTGGIALLVYVVMALIVPEEDNVGWVPPAASPPASPPPEGGASVAPGEPTTRAEWRPSGAPSARRAGTSGRLHPARSSWASRSSWSVPTSCCASTSRPSTPIGSGRSRSLRSECSC